jgi:peptide/nickel transport system substrate-binding protein
MRTRLHLGALALVLGATVVGTAGGTTRADAQQGNIFRVAFRSGSLDYLDPALSYTAEGWALLDTTCARLMTYPDKPPPTGLRLVPEVATDFPKISRNGKTYTFTLGRGFRFSDGSPVQASAFARAINRTLDPGVKGNPAVQYTRDIVGAADVQAGRTSAAAGIVARGNTLVIRFTRPTFDFAAKTTMPFFCAVPPALPVDPEGVLRVPAAGPYVVTDYRPGERVVLRRNRFYRGSRPHHVDGFDVDLRAAGGPDALDRVERGDADWTIAGVAPAYFTAGRDLARKYGVNKSRFFVTPGFTIRYLTFNVSRPLFRNNPSLRRAVNFALDRRALTRVSTNSRLGARLTDQYLPPSFPGFRDVDVYPLKRADLRRARGLAHGSTRNGKATMYVASFPMALAAAQLVRRQLAEIRLDVEVEALPPTAYLGRIADPDEPWDLALTAWAPDFIDPFTYINLQLDGRFIPPNGGNFGGFDSPKYNELMRRAARLRGAERYRRYGELDIRIAREAAPTAPLNVFTEPTLVSERVSCLVLRPALDLTAACLK